MHDATTLSASMLLLAPAFLVFAMAMVVMLVEAFQRPADKSGFALATLVTLFGAGAGTAWLSAQVSEPIVAFGGMLQFDAYGVFFQAAAIVSGILAVAISNGYLDRIGVRIGEYYALVLFGVFGMMLMGFANDLMMVFIAIEVMSLSMYILCAIKRGDPNSVESGFKYFILGAFSSGLMLYGISLLYGATGTTELGEVARRFGSSADGGHAGLAYVGGALLIAGFGFKVASVPFHMWTPDVYQGAPTSVTALMSGGVKAASFAAFGRVVIVVLGADAHGFDIALWWMAAATMLVGNLAALVQDDLKRMLAYSSIAHAGYLMMALVAVGDHGGTGVGSLLFYTLAYTFMNAGTWAVLTMLATDEEDTSVSALAGLGRTHPWLAAALSVCLLSLAGIPPTMGFVGKFYLFAAAIESGSTSLAIVGAIAAACGVYYYLRPMLVMYMHDGHPKLADDRWAVGTVTVCALVVVAFGVMPSPVLAWAQASVASIVAG